MDEATRALVLYAYTLGGNTRTMAELTGIDHDAITDGLAQAAHEDAMRKVADDMNRLVPLLPPEDSSCG
jgi:hypothetical protein